MKDEIYHHGIKGMKWGVRRYQNYDGSLKAAGKKRYGNPQNNKKIQTETGILLSLAAMQAAHAFYEKKKSMRISYISSSMIAIGGAYVTEWLSRNKNPNK